MNGKNPHSRYGGWLAFPIEGGSFRFEENEVSFWQRTKVMSLFKKNIHPQDLGMIVYERLRAGVESDGDLSLQGLVSGLGLHQDELEPQYVGEIMIGVMFAAALAIESQAGSKASQQIVAALKGEFFNHLDEQGASPLQIAEWEAVLADRFLTYRQAMEGYSGFEPPWKLGRALFWHIISDKLHLAMSVKICTLYMLAARDASYEILREYGPRLIMEPTST